MGEHERALAKFRQPVFERLLGHDIVPKEAGILYLTATDNADMYATDLQGSVE